ncbi:hypothetical protein AXG93_606s1230 [Marchantia polymorpha subsp. ruderalis]|uniref:ELK domain-containing protein n=1 Tax=Marchantia polymorpha subsp. ruderalis TaxID=1480154 RepID=A0A176VKG3_MARPO|nr:hypothetical protein AXG93_606s1230 [Marchantia polymorpha subsp. ruderalis]
MLGSSSFFDFNFDQEVANLHLSDYCQTEPQTPLINTHTTLFTQGSSPNYQSQVSVDLQTESFELSPRGLSTMTISEDTGSEYHAATTEPFLYLSDLETPLQNTADGKQDVTLSVNLTASDTTVRAEIQESGEKPPCNSGHSLLDSISYNSSREAENDIEFWLRAYTAPSKNLPFGCGEPKKTYHKIADGNCNVVDQKPWGPQLLQSSEAPNHVLSLETRKDGNSSQVILEGQSNLVEVQTATRRSPRSLEALKDLGIFMFGETEEPCPTVAEGKLNIENTDTLWQPQSEPHDDTLFGELFNFDDRAEDEDHRQYVLGSMLEELEKFVDKSDNELCRSSETTNELDLQCLIVHHPDLPKIIVASLACYKIRADEEEKKQLDEVANLSLSKLPAQDQLLGRGYSSKGKDPRLDLCLDKYLKALDELEKHISKLVTSADTHCVQMKQNILIQCPELGDVSKQSESDSVSGGQSELFTEEMEKIIQDHEKAKDRPQRSALPMLTDQEWRGAILAAYNPSLLRTLKTRHLKEGRRNLKLPDPARRILLNWWTEHQGKPYPSVVGGNVCSAVDIDHRAHQFSRKERRQL